MEQVRFLLLGITLPTHPFSRHSPCMDPTLAPLIGHGKRPPPLLAGAGSRVQV